MDCVRRARLSHSGTFANPSQNASSVQLVTYLTVLVHPGLESGNRNLRLHTSGYVPTRSCMRTFMCGAAVRRHGRRVRHAQIKFKHTAPPSPTCATFVLTTVTWRAGGFRTGHQSLSGVLVLRGDTLFSANADATIKVSVVLNEYHCLW